MIRKDIGGANNADNRYLDRYSKWNEWRQTQDSPYSYRNEEEKLWSWNRFRDDRFMSSHSLTNPSEHEGFPMSRYVMVTHCPGTSWKR